MHAIRERRELELRSYAKINLALDVTGIRPDGYHSVDTIMQRVSLADLIQISWQPEDGADAAEPAHIIVTTTKPYLPTDRRNLAYRAAEAMLEEAKQRGYTPRGMLRIHIEKRIPVAAGLGGGSGNCAAVLIGLNRIWKLRCNTRKLCEIAATMGSDIPFCVLVQNTPYRCAWGTGRGEELRGLRVGLRKYLLLAKPAFGVSTKEVFAGIDTCEITEHPDLQRLKKALGQKNDEEIYRNMINVLENYTLPRYPRVKELKDKIAATDGARKVLMSGSGPTVIGVYDSYRAAKQACVEIRKAGFEAYWADTIR